MKMSRIISLYYKKINFKRRCKYGIWN